MFNKENHLRIFIGGFITGGIMGGIAGLLLAPKSGKKLRRSITKKADHLIDDTNKMMENAGKVASNIISDAKKKAERIIN